uniref:Uncharacterized protein n=1 Tax=Nelumbo nucifera TaxID=4432 RepID=A0A822Y431_NELNU|nr:TPA_asm: hypothetical protein HUJ06_028221 [Nelumbo nucifera]
MIRPQNLVLLGLLLVFVIVVMGSYGGDNRKMKLITENGPLNPHADQMGANMVKHRQIESLRSEENMNGINTEANRSTDSNGPYREASADGHHSIDLQTWSKQHPKPNN